MAVATAVGPGVSGASDVATSPLLAAADGEVATVGAVLTATDGAAADALGLEVEPVHAATNAAPTSRTTLRATAIVNERSMETVMGSPFRLATGRAWPARGRPRRSSAGHP